MNYRHIVFSSLITSVIGILFALVVLKVAAPPFQSQRYQQLTQSYPWIGAVSGLAAGASVNAVFQLKSQRDRLGE
ncbi:hypothetical protein [Nodosilinea sp. E11]|uniref:hypothetical protein n=1 Tax=Nodosilinea sp. E11 TaxID=3037479 RepID=UPI002934CC3A|nr:hypothetical protein [Nodosilinea sp. E11]WOD37030.1 hypothetical protein RRF56_00805 [Nodosilinea sp. E11]